MDVGGDARKALVHRQKLGGPFQQFGHDRRQAVKRSSPMLGPPSPAIREVTNSSFQARYVDINFEDAARTQSLKDDYTKATEIPATRGRRRRTTRQCGHRQSQGQDHFSQHMCLLLRYESANPRAI